MEEYGPPIHSDIFGGRIFLIVFGDHNPDDFDEEVDQPSQAYLIVHPSGAEIWTRNKEHAYFLLKPVENTLFG